MIDIDYVRNFRQTILGDFNKHQSERVAIFESRLKPGLSVEDRLEKVNAFKRRVKVQFLTEKFGHKILDNINSGQSEKRSNI